MAMAFTFGDSFEVQSRITEIYETPYPHLDLGQDDSRAPVWVHLDKGLGTPADLEKVSVAHLQSGAFRIIPEREPPDSAALLLISLPRNGGEIKWTGTTKVQHDGLEVGWANFPLSGEGVHCIAAGTIQAERGEMATEVRLLLMRAGASFRVWMQNPKPPYAANDLFVCWTGGRLLAGSYTAAFDPREETLDDATFL